MTHQQAILAALDALTLAVAENTRTRANEKTTTETLEARYGPKPEPVENNKCPQTLYTTNKPMGNVEHRCTIRNNHPGSHQTIVYGTTIAWYNS